MKINRNIAWAESFVNEIAACGVKYVCISSGSRNTPLTWAFAQNKNIRKYVIIDERSSAFFALGLANSIGSPVALVCTSGTAAVEYYPAIVEAYHQRIPLVICTADRPPELRNTGTNQTINQDNLYRNHIRFFADAGLPLMSENKITALKRLAIKAIKISTHKNKGPVHINFPFNKPFEPDNFTDEVNHQIHSLLIKTIYKPGRKSTAISLDKEKWFLQILEKLKNVQRGLIIVGPEMLSDEFHTNILKISKLIKYPIIADGCSQLRFLPCPTYSPELKASDTETLFPKANKSSGITGTQGNEENIICNYETMFRSATFIENCMPELILHFGRTNISKGLEDFYGKYSVEKIMINEEGDVFDANRSGKLYKCSPSLFCKSILEHYPISQDIRNEDCWLTTYIEADKSLEHLKKNMLFNSGFPNEIRIIKELLDTVPSNSSIMLSNSLPVRDFDYWASCSSKKLNIYNNRGASGIDGIISTALGIASENKDSVYLITGDLAFYYDINALLIAKKYSIPLIVILINNNGGGIFNSLPVSRYPDFLQEYFITPHELNFGKLTKAFGVNYFRVTSWPDLKEILRKAGTGKEASVIEINTDSVSSLELRNQYWKESNELLNSLIKQQSQ
jgi:2-succinyl-5-enolpyruvyl-6-hydroxy-3-cyclohexene-1-carboxylate synthase